MKRLASIVAGLFISSAMLAQDVIIGDRLDGGVDRIKVEEPIAKRDRSMIGGALDIKNILFIPVNFEDRQVLLDRDELWNKMFSPLASINDLYRETSFDDFTFDVATSEISPDVDIPFQTDTCSYWQWTLVADQILTSQGTPVENFTHKVYLMPSTACHYSGLGSLDCGYDCRSWIFGNTVPWIIAHELGHNLGLNHSSEDLENDGVIDDEYGDDSDFLGSPLEYSRLNGPHMIQMGWIRNDAIVDVRSNGMYRLDFLGEGADFFPQVLRFFKEDTQEEYFVSFRAPVGYDMNLYPEYVGKTTVHVQKGTGNTKLVALLNEGGTFSDPANGILITASSNYPFEALVDIIGDFECHEQDSDVSFAPQISVVPPFGSFRGYVAVQNKDGRYCDKSTFVASSELPISWDSQAYMVLDPKESKNISGVISVSTGVEGTIQFMVDVEHVGRETKQFQSSVIVDGTPPSPAVIAREVFPDYPSYVKLTWPPAYDAVGVYSYEVYRNGQFYQSLPSETRVTEDLVHEDTSYYVVAQDYAGNVSLPSNKIVVNTGCKHLASDGTCRDIFSDGFEDGDLKNWSSHKGSTKNL